MYAIQNQPSRCNICDEYKGFTISISFDRFVGSKSQRGEIRVFNANEDVTNLFSRDGSSMIASVETVLEIRQIINSFQE